MGEIFLTTIQTRIQFLNELSFIIAKYGKFSPFQHGIVFDNSILGYSR